MAKTPEEEARENIDRQLDACGWKVQDRSEADIDAALGVALRERSRKKREVEVSRS